MGWWRHWSDRPLDDGALNVDSVRWQQDLFKTEQNKEKAACTRDLRGR